ncbi:MAG: hypothetical protein J6Z12_00175 [Paludibacteraceae bacterium]|nr:hypothetical protein [Paludibacteraceae bacterium]
MRRILANMFSYLFQPLLVPVYGFFLLAFDPHFVPYVPLLKVRFLLLAMLILVVIPVAWYWLLRRLEIITTPQAERRNERFWAYLVTMVAYVVAWLLARHMRIETDYAFLFLSGAVALLILTIVNFFWKMSAHALGMGAMLGGILAVSLLQGGNPVGLYTTFILLGGMVGSARMELGAHTFRQVAAGYLTGLLSPALTLFVLLSDVKI